MSEVSLLEESTYVQVEMFKFCIKCKEDKLPSEFQKDRNECKSCKKQIDYIRKLPLRKYIWEFKKANPCVKCGETDPVVLIFDHLKDKNFDISRMVGDRMTLEKIQEEIKLTRILCANCHARVTCEQQNWYKEFVEQT